MQKSENIQNIAKALAAFQAEVKNPANSADNPFFKSKYAPLNEILNDVRPLLTKNGLSVLQFPSGEGDNVVITTLLMHESGEWIESSPLVLKMDKPTAQGAGSSITYGRRYQLAAILGISSEDDDDGNAASGNKDKTKPAPQKSTPKPEPHKPPQATRPTGQPQGEKAKVNWSGFWANAVKLGFKRDEVHQVAGVESITGWTQAQVDQLTDQLTILSAERKAG